MDNRIVLIKKNITMFDTILNDLLLLLSQSRIEYTAQGPIRL